MIASTRHSDLEAQLTRGRCACVVTQYYDEYGRKMTQKQAFRQLSWKFHGKMPSKKRREKRMQEVEKQMSEQTKDRGMEYMGALQQVAAFSGPCPPGAFVTCTLLFLRPLCRCAPPLNAALSSRVRAGAAEHQVCARGHLRRASSQDERCGQAAEAAR